MLTTNARTRTVAATAGVTAAAALVLAAPALAGAISASGPLTTYSHSPAPIAGAPAGATARVHVVETGSEKTIVTLHVSGLEGGKHYGAHAHVNPCGDKPAAAGPHFQKVPDPVQPPTTNPVYANPENEIWLDLATNPAGEGHAKSVVDWQFGSGPRPQSVIIHEKPTSTEPGQAGTAGKRVACLTVPF